MTRFIVVPRETVLKRQRLQRQNDLARARYESRNLGRSHHDALGEQLARDMSWKTKRFVMWDGEGPKDAGYALFGNSLGYEICHPYLGTTECLSLVLDTARDYPQSIHIAFGFNYDVSMILRELSHRSLIALNEYTHTTWKGYEIEHIPHKWFRVKYGYTSCKIYDIRSFFGGDYKSALRDFEIGTDTERETISTGKGNRASFLWEEIEDIRDYWRLELKLGVELGEALRTVFADAGYIPRSWHGPGALARMALKRHKIYDAMAETPPEVREASQYAFAGGRFEPFLAGHINGRVYNADINSAYPHYATKLPNLSAGHWEHVRDYRPRMFGVYHIRYDADPDNTKIFPLFRRLSNGCVVWPNRVTGWYWSPEADTVKDDPAATFLEGWVFHEDDPSDRPFAWIADYYQKRKRLKDAGSAAEYTFKLIINSVYGQLAQRAGWDRKNHTAPRSHQLEWAGYITSGCRGSIYKAARSCGEKLISVDTDGIYSRAPIPDIDIGASLGQWSTDEYHDGIFWQSGIYCLATEDGWKKAKSRGIRKGSYTADELLRCVYERDTLKLSKRMFITYGLAAIHGWELHNTWIDEPHEYEMGGSKRAHWPKACETFCEPPIHRLAQWSPLYGVGATDDAHSVKHSLPWLRPDPRDKGMARAMQLFGTDLDDEDEWVYDEQYV